MISCIQLGNLQISNEQQQHQKVGMVPGSDAIDFLRTVKAFFLHHLTSCFSNNILKERRLKMPAYIIRNPEGRLSNFLEWVLKTCKRCVLVEKKLRSSSRARQYVKVLLPNSPTGIRGT